MHIIVEKYHGSMMQPAARITAIDPLTLERVQSVEGLIYYRIAIWLRIYQDRFSVARAPFDGRAWLLHAPYNDFTYDAAGQLVSLGLWEPGQPIPTGGGTSG